MRIKSLELQDFGPHRHLQLDLDAAIVGILGPNGGGKTTILNALKLALTGELDDPLETYIRGRGINVEAVTDAAKRAEVTLPFRADGIDAAVKRSITPATSKRELIWDGQTHTKAADVDAILKDLLGADKKALAAIVFPAQGELDKLLFGKQSEREEMFLRLLILTHFSRVSDLADSKRILISSEINDMTAQKDQLAVLMDDYNRALTQAESELATHSSWSEDLAVYRKVSAAADKTQWTLSSLSRASETVRARRAELEQMCDVPLTDENDTPLPRPLTLGALESSIQVARATEGQLGQLHESKLAALRVKGQIETLNATSKQASAELENLRAQKSGWEQRLAELRAHTPESLDQLIRDMLAYDRDLATRQEAHRTLDTANSELPALQATLTTSTQEIAQLTAEGRIARDAHNAAAARLRTVTNSTKAEGGVCGECGAPVKPATPEELAKAQALEAEAQQAVRAIEQKYRDAVAREAAANYQLERLSQTVANCQTALAVPAPTRPETTLDLQTAEMLKQEILGLRENLNQMVKTGREHALVSQIQGAADAVATLSQGNMDSDGLDAVGAALQKVRAWLTQAEAKASALRALTNDVHQAALQEANAQAEYARAQLEETTARGEMSARLLQAIAHQGDQVAVWMEQVTTAHAQAMGRVESARQSLVTLRQKQAEIEAREQFDRARAQVAEELRAIKEAFQRRGLPLTYIQFRFEQLAELANRNLQSLDANFVVQPSKEESVSLTFQRTDDNSEAVFGMNKLSGGQRVRVTIAFLLAVQQLIIPDLGLLVLDEPSMHLSDEGVESLADLLQTLGTQLSALDAQIIICDHNHRLERAFQKVVRL